MSHEPRATSRALSVQLCYASLPSIFGLIADHYWFVVRDEQSGASHRWEIWHRRNVGGRSIGHLHCDLLEPDADVGGGPTHIAAEWRGAEARALRAVLQRPEDYPHCHLYRYWPGPNSNSFAAWVLREAGIEHPLGWRAIGSKYRMA